MQEWEIYFDPKDFEKAVDLFNHLGLPAKTTKDFQERHNYVYNGVEIAVKFSEQWQYHVEMEIVVDDMQKKIEAKEKIKAVADELGIKLMTDEEVRIFTKKFEDKL